MTDPTRPLSALKGGDLTIASDGDTVERLPRGAATVAAVYYPCERMTPGEARALLVRLVDPDAYPTHPDEMAAEIVRLTAERDAVERSRDDWHEACVDVRAERDRLRDTLREVLERFMPEDGAPGAWYAARSAVPAQFHRWLSVLDATPPPEPTPAAPADDEMERNFQDAGLRWLEQKAAERAPEGLTATGRYDEGQPTYYGPFGCKPETWEFRYDDTERFLPHNDGKRETWIVECRPPVPVPEPRTADQRLDAVVEWVRDMDRLGTRVSTARLLELLTEDDDQ
jgi:hypothetical protein